MSRPCHSLLLVAALLGAALPGRGEQPVTGVKPAGTAAPPRERIVTSRVAEMLAAAQVRYTPAPIAAEPVATAPAVSAPSPRMEREAPANGIVRLPNYIVRERRPPKTWETLSPDSQARMGMEKFIGPERGLDRGVLNLFTVKSLWNKLPVVGKFELRGFMSNEERGLLLYREAKKREETENWLDFMPPGAAR